MNYIYLAVTISAKDAILAGKDGAGIFNLQVEPSKLTADQRATLAGLSPVSAQQPNVLNFPGLSRPLSHVEKSDVPALLDELKIDSERRAQHKLAKQKAQYEECRPDFLAKTLPPLDSIVAQPPSVMPENPIMKIALRKEQNLVWFEKPSFFVLEEMAPPALSWTVPMLAESMAKQSVQNLFPPTLFERNDFKEMIIKEKADIFTSFIEADSEIMARITEAQESCIQITALVNEMHRVWHSAAQAALNESRQKLEAAASRRAEQIAEWVRQKGTATQKKKFAANLLDEEEVLTGMRNEIFKALSSMARYKRIIKTELQEVASAAGRNDLAQYPPGIEYTTSEPKSLTDAQFDVFEKIREAIPGAKVTLKEHRAAFTGPADILTDIIGTTGILTDAPQISRLSAHVEVNVGEITVTREYAID